MRKNKIIIFFETFMAGWMGYAFFKDFCKNHIDPEMMAKMEASDRERGVKTPKTRFGYAWMNAMAYWKHRDKYSEKCTGECEECTCKHC